MTDTNALKKKISESGYKMEFISDKLSISRASFHMKLTNSSRFKVDEMYKLCDLLDIDENEAKDIFFAEIVPKMDTEEISDDCCSND